MKENPENTNYIKAFQDLEDKKYMRRFREISKGLINPPAGEFERLAEEFVMRFNNIPILGAADYRIEQILEAFPERRKEFESNVGKLQEITQEKEESCIRRLVDCSLDMDMALRSLEEPRLIWDKLEDIQLIESMRKKSESEIGLFRMYKGEESLEKRKKFLERLEIRLMKQSRLEK